MALGWVLAATALGPAATTFAAPAGAQTQPAAALSPVPGAPKPKPIVPVAATQPASGLISNVFVETDLRQALQDIAAQAQATIIAEPSVGGTISAELKNVPLDKALEIVLAGSGYFVKKTPDYYLVYAPDIKGLSFRQVSQTRAIKLGNITPDVVGRLLSPAFRDYVQVDPQGSTVTVTAPEPLLTRIVADVQQLDQPLRHVQLEARVVVLERTAAQNIGTLWSFPQIQAGLFTNDTLGSSWPWGVGIGYAPNQTFTNSLLLTLNLLAQNDEATIVANPQVMAQDGKSAQINVSTDQYFEIVSPGTYIVQST